MRRNVLRLLSISDQQSHPPVSHCVFLVAICLHHLGWVDPTKRQAASHRLLHLHTRYLNTHWNTHTYTQRKRKKEIKYIPSHTHRGGRGDDSGYSGTTRADQEYRSPAWRATHQIRQKYKRKTFQQYTYRKMCTKWDCQYQILFPLSDKDRRTDSWIRRKNTAQPCGIWWGMIPTGASFRFGVVKLSAKVLDRSERSGASYARTSGTVFLLMTPGFMQRFLDEHNHLKAWNIEVTELQLHPYVLLLCNSVALCRNLWEYFGVCIIIFESKRSVRYDRTEKVIKRPAGNSLGHFFRPVIPHASLTFQYSAPLIW